MPITPEAIARTGLCATCRNAATCVYRSKRGFDALYCEMFDDSTTTSATERNQGVADNPKAAMEHAAGEAAPVSYKGLCVNCANRESCALPKPEEGVWHCEEYC